MYFQNESPLENVFVKILHQLLHSLLMPFAFNAILSYGKKVNFPFIGF